MISEDLLLSSAFSAIFFILACCVVGKILDSIRNAVFGKMGGLFLWTTFVGVAHHELAHTLLALVTGARVESVVLFRLKAKNGNVGEVVFRPRGKKIFQALQILFTSAAPMLLGCLSLWLAMSLLNPTLSGWKLWALIWIEISVFLNMSLSKQDVKNILSKFGWLFIFLFGIFYGFKINLIGSFSDILFK